MMFPPFRLGEVAQSHSMPSWILPNKIVRFKKNEPIPEEIQDDNAIVCRDKKSKVRNLARHIRNAFAHSHISKEGGFFLMHDWWAGNKKLPARCTMRGKVSVDVMPEFLEAIKASRRIREANRQ